ncbi:MAG: tyrosine-type recombinase/integrase [Gammaproteobacteria bacterium]|nr:tyrosine-type recombinase/integrase [Gammaproteobacteria bacterium]
MTREKVQIKYPDRQFPRRQTNRLFYPDNEPLSGFPVRSVQIDWGRLEAKRRSLLGTRYDMPAYLIKPEVLRLLDAEKHPTYRLILDLMWSTGARVSEVLALKPTSFRDDGYDFLVKLKTLKQRPGRPTKRALQRSPGREIPIMEPALQDRIQSYLYANHFRDRDRLFPMCRQTVNRHIKKLVDQEGGAPFRISAHTFRHSFAVHMLLHACPMKVLSNLLGHQSIESTEIYTNVLTVDSGHFLEVVEFH